MGSIRRLLLFVFLIPAAFLLYPEASPRGRRSLDPKLLATLECSQSKPEWTVRKLASGREIRIVSSETLDLHDSTSVMNVEYLTDLNPRRESCALRWEMWDLMMDLKPEAEASGASSIMV